MKHKKLAILGIALLITIILIAVFKAPEKLKEKGYIVKGKIAIVVDDWGNHPDNLSLAKQIKYPLTCAILPNLKYSSFVAKNLNDSSFEIILHLPMEPKSRKGMEKDTILADMGEEQIKGIMNRALDSVMFAKGINNHMGSKATEDKEIMSLVMAEAKLKKLYFLDSYVTSKSVAGAAAASVKIKFAKRDIFLDNQNNPDYIRGQIIKLKNLARKQGKAIGIGHDRKNTLRVLREMMPRLEREGYKLVFVSEIIG